MRMIHLFRDVTIFILLLIILALWFIAKVPLGLVKADK